VLINTGLCRLRRKCPLKRNKNVNLLSGQDVMTTCG